MQRMHDAREAQLKKQQALREAREQRRESERLIPRSKRARVEQHEEVQTVQL